MSPRLAAAEQDVSGEALRTSIEKVDIAAYHRGRAASVFGAEPASLSTGAISPIILPQRDQGASPSHLTTVRPFGTVAISNGRVVRHNLAQARREKAPKGFGTRLLLRSMPILCQGLFVDTRRSNISIRVANTAAQGNVLVTYSQESRPERWRQVGDGPTGVGQGFGNGSFDCSRVVLAPARETRGFRYEVLEGARSSLDVAA